MMTLMIILLLLCSIILTLGIIVGDKNDKRRFHKEGLIIIPGVGRADRLQTVAHNLRLLESNYLNDDGNRPSRWDCIIYVYAMHNNTEFWYLSSVSYTHLTLPTNREV